MLLEFSSKLSIRPRIRGQIKAWTLQWSRFFPCNAHIYICIAIQNQEWLRLDYQCFAIIPSVQVRAAQLYRNESSKTQPQKPALSCMCIQYCRNARTRSRPNCSYTLIRIQQKEINRLTFFIYIKGVWLIFQDWLADHLKRPLRRRLIQFWVSTIRCINRIAKIYKAAGFILQISRRIQLKKN